MKVSIYLNRHVFLMVIFYNVSMERKCPDETLRMREMNLHLCILHMLEDTFLLDVAHCMTIVLGRSAM